MKTPKQEVLNNIINLVRENNINFDKEIFLFISLYRKLLNKERGLYFANVNNDLLKFVEKFLLESNEATINKRIKDIDYIFDKLNNNLLESISASYKEKYISVIYYIFNEMVDDDINIIVSSSDENYYGFEFKIENILTFKFVICSYTVYLVSDLDNMKFPSKLFHEETMEETMEQLDFPEIIEPYIKPVEIFHGKLKNWLLPKDYIECYKLIKNNYYEFHFTKKGIRVICIKDDNSKENDNEYCYLYVDILEIKIPLTLRTINYEIGINNLDELYNYLDTQFKILVNFHVNSKK